MPQDDSVAIAAQAVTRVNDFAVGDGIDGLTDIGGHIHALMHLAPTLAELRAKELLSY